MPNIAQVLKQEFSRIARKELRDQNQSLKKATAQSRTDIIALKKRVAELERLINKLAPAQKKKKNEKIAVDNSPRIGTRFSPTRLAAHRQRLGLSAAEMGFLLNASALSVYKWESGAARPRPKYMPAIAALRTLSKPQAIEVLKSR